MDEKRLHTQRLTLRRIRKEDRVSVQWIWEDANSSPYAQYDRPHNIDSCDVRSRITRWAEVSQGIEHIFFAICLKEKMIGYIAFNKRVESYEIGYCFHSDYHGKGYAREGLSALIEYMKSLGAKRLTAGTAINNTPSVKLLTALGFQQTKTEKISFYQNEDGTSIFFEGGVHELNLLV
ncbi:MAG TPA: GNAT family N-acetyltransferase [Candidatus Faecousia excrementipullorum]|nr:GNAT family N-acetyltransferase [Candidatus Faecousia excrementipullorum]